MKLKKILYFGFVCTVAPVLATKSAHADYVAKVHNKIYSEAGAVVNDSRGDVFGKRGKMRMDVNMMGMRSSVIALAQSKKVFSILHDAKMVMEVDLSTFAQTSQNGMVMCLEGDNLRCLTGQGFREVGSETKNGYPCKVMELTTNSGGQNTTLKVWAPTNLPEVGVVAIEHRGVNGRVLMEANYTDVRSQNVPDSKFVVPSDYSKVSGALPGMPGAGSGGTPTPAPRQRGSR